MRIVAMRFATIGLLVALAFIAGINIGRAQQASVGWSTPMVIHVAKLTTADLPPKPADRPTANQAKIVAATDGGKFKCKSVRWENKSRWLPVI